MPKSRIGQTAVKQSDNAVVKDGQGTGCRVVTLTGKELGDRNAPGGRFESGRLTNSMGFGKR